MTHHDEFDAAMSRPEEHMRQALESAARLLGDVVEGIGEGKTRGGEPCIVVMVSSRTPEVEERIPERIEGVPVELVETGPFVAGG
jgi:hypothetical protein